MMNFDNIFIIQSYPNLIELLSKLPSYKGHNAIIVNLDRDIYRFLKQIKQLNAEVFCFGDARFFRSRLYRPFIKIYIKYFERSLPRFRTKRLVLTYGNWCDVGCLYLKHIEFGILENWIAFEEQRYEIIDVPEKALTGYLKTIDDLAPGLLVLKDYVSYIKQDRVILPGVGLKDLQNVFPHTEQKYVKQAKNVTFEGSGAFELDKEFVLFIEREIVRSQNTSWFSLFKLLLNLKRTTAELGIRTAIKFKPRQFTFRKYFFYRLFGFAVLPREVPAQVYAFQEACIGIIGFTSSSMANDYGKPVISLSCLRGYFKKPMVNNVESMRQRTANVNGLYFPKDFYEFKKYCRLLATEGKNIIDDRE